MSSEMTIQQFQDLIRDRYFSTDSARGVSKTFLWLTEEFGELSHALGEFERGNADLENLAEEFADVLAWLVTIANITGIDLTDAVIKKYVTDGGPKGTK